MVFKWSWPSTSWTARTSTPFCSISVAAVCRSLWELYSAGSDARLTQPLFHHGVDRGAADPLVLGGEEEGVCVPAGDGPPHCQIFGDGVLAGVVQ